MASILTKIIDTGGTGDYLSLEAAWADKGVGYPTNLVSNDVCVRKRRISRYMAITGKQLY